MESIILALWKNASPIILLLTFRPASPSRESWPLPPQHSFNAVAMGLSDEQTLLVLASLTRAMFYKSMTTHADSSIWQDVYHSPTLNGKVAYIKLTLHQGAVVIQFKEK
jgi:hypothetical protein